MSVIYLGFWTPTSTLSASEMLPESEQADFRRLDETFRRQDDLLIVAVEGRDAAPTRERIAHVESQIADIGGVQWTWSAASRPKLFLQDGPTFELGIARGPAEPPSIFDRFLSIDDHTRVIVADLGGAKRSLAEAEETVRSLERIATDGAEPGERFVVLGLPHLQVATANQIARDVRWALPLLLATVVFVPLLIFRSFGAVLFPFAMASVTTALTLGAYHLAHGAVYPAAVVLLPFAWAIATLDALHLYNAYRRSSVHGPAAASEARRAVALPCLMTTLTTMAGLLVLAVLSVAPILKLLGVWGMVAAAIAYALTFVSGTVVLGALPTPAAMPKWSTRWLRIAVIASQRRAALVLVFWVPVLTLAGWSLRHVELSALYPDVFVDEHPVSSRLQAVSDKLGIELAPVEIVIEPTSAEATKPYNVVQASMALQGRLEKIPELRLALSSGLFARELARSSPSVLARARELEADPARHDSVVATAQHPEVKNWLRFSDGISRTIALFEPVSIDRSQEIFAALREHDQEVMTGYRYHFGGIGYLRQAMQKRILDEMLRGMAATLVAVLGLLALVLRSARYLLVATVANVAPVALVGGAMVALDIPWTLGIVAVPVLLLAISVDDTIHLLWPLRRASVRAPTALSKSVRGAGPALVATTLVLAGCFGTLMLSGFRLNHDLGMLVALGLIAALVLDLTLVPALLAATVSRKRVPNTS